ncbi:TonB-dependent receptor [Salinimicrobium sp. GXAS 041]|uniref:TonB-dependent receptor n=1 Tax=Salinimicrobium sp. GXAS 041 TaxID=3400806 RepID=UPI003C73D62F
MSIRNSVFLVLFMITGAVFSQDLGSETVVVVKPYTPSVNDAFKIRETPVINDSLSLEKKPVQYSIFSVPVASTFSPAKGRATSVERERLPEVYENYATLAFGSYTNALAEFYSNLEVNRTDNFGIFLTHNSSQGGIEEVNFDDKYYETQVDLNYSSRQRNMSWNTDFGLEHRLFNWYGIPVGYQAQTLGEDFTQNYFSAYLGGEMNFEDSFFDGMKAKYRYFGDSFSSAEHHLTARPELELPIAGEIFKTNIIFDYVTGSFEKGFSSEEEINYGFMNIGLSSGLVVLRDDLTLNLGAALYYSHDTNGDNSGVYLYPRINASYRLAGEYFVAYAGLEGELKQNSYYSLSQENWFVSPTLEIQPTDQQFDLYVGGKGKLSNSVGYDVRARYIAENYKPLFIKNPVVIGADEMEDYAYGNSFGVVYDRVNTISGFGELNLDLSRKFNLRINGEYYIYDTDEQEEAWNLPDFKVSLLGDYQITEKWYAGANFFIVGERKDFFSLYSEALIQQTSEEVTLDGFVDLNANLGYRFNEQLSAFVRGNNLLGNNYERYMDFPVLGLQVMGGITYKFNY